MKNSSRVLWDDVPAAVKADLASRRGDRVGATAISEAVAGERWYFRREAAGWNNTGVDRSANAPAVASDLTPEQRTAAEETVRRVEELRQRAAEQAAPAAPPSSSAETELEELAQKLASVCGVSVAEARKTIQDAMDAVVGATLRATVDKLLHEALPKAYGAPTLAHKYGLCPVAVDGKHHWSPWEPHLGRRDNERRDCYNCGEEETQVSPMTYVVPCPARGMAHGWTAYEPDLIDPDFVRRTCFDCGSMERINQNLLNLQERPKWFAKGGLVNRSTFAGVPNAGYCPNSPGLDHDMTGWQGKLGELGLTRQCMNGCGWTEHQPQGFKRDGLDKVRMVFDFEDRYFGKGLVTIQPVSDSAAIESHDADGHHCPVCCTDPDCMDADCVAELGDPPATSAE